MRKEVEFRGNKRGLTPIIATVLLVSISLALAVIIFIWAKGVFVESIMKGEISVEDACSGVSFDTDYDAEIGEISFVNTGDIPIYSFDIKEKGGGDITSLDNDIGGADVGESKSLPLEIDSNAKELVVTPILLGEGDASRKQWECDKDYSKTIGIGTFD